MNTPIEAILGKTIATVRLMDGDLQILDENSKVLMTICRAITGDGTIRLPIMTPDGDEFNYYNLRGQKFGLTIARKKE